MVDEGRKQRVIPAKAGTHDRRRARGLPWMAAFVGIDLLSNYT
jgi:hypothetical protein